MLVGPLNQHSQQTAGEIAVLEGKDGLSTPRLVVPNIDRVTQVVVRDHFETFRTQAADLRDGAGLPGFVEREFHKFLQCGAHLVDHVFPRVPVRQWVLSLPYRLRYRLAWDHALCRDVVGCAMRAIGPTA